jgi:Pup amidohydrolase
MVANSVAILDRLVGLETEYAIRFHPREEGTASPSRFHLYQALIARLKRHVLTAPARHIKEGVFLANGGAVWFETDRPAGGGGLIEGSTPECRGPLQVVRYQRAQDQLLSQCARLADVEGDFTLIKNDRDAPGNTYGAQENYEAIVGTGWSLWCWRVGLILLVPLVILTLLGVLLTVVAFLIYLGLAALVCLPLRWFTSQPRRVALALFGRDLVEGRETGCPVPAWLEGVLISLTRLIQAPLAVCLTGLIGATVFRRTRRELLPFLVSRCLIAGAGTVDAENHFQLADKAPAVNCVLSLGAFASDRPVFAFGHFIKTLCVESVCAPREFFLMFRARQRLQISLGDSNMSETAEFLRVGTTALVLDVIEAGELPPLARMPRPIEALHRFCSDPTLTCAVRLRNGQRVTALQLQRFYLAACQQFLARRPDAPEEALEVAAAWEEVLDALEQLQLSGEAPPALIGTVDWVTKRQLVDEAGRDTPWAARKKIDIAYHELSPLGYFQMLQAAGLAPTFTSLQDLDRAARTPPPNSPATMRGHFIREFSSDDTELSVNWKRIVIGRGADRKSVRLARYDRPVPVVPDQPPLGTHDPGRSST